MENFILNKSTTVEEKSAENNSIFEVLSEMFPAPVGLIKNYEGAILKCNNCFLTLFNIDCDGIKSKNFFDFIVAAEKREEIIKELTSNSSLKDYEVILSDNESNCFCALISTENLTYDSEPAFLISVINVSQREVFDEENRRLLEELEISKELIEEEAAKMIKINIQLEESEEKLRELNAAKDKLFSIIGHDLKNPFFVISSYVEIINEEYYQLSDEKKHEIIKSIGETSKFANRLLEDLLHWARTQTGRIEFNPEPLNLRRTVNTTIELLKSQASKKNIKLVSLIDPTYIVNADRNMTETIFRNLISNAIKFSSENGEVKISAKDKNEFFELTVSDNGIGMSPDDISKLFRIDVNNSQIGHSKEKGTGLGLILCKEFVERHGGKIWVESAEDQGSNFYFTLCK